MLTEGSVGNRRDREVPGVFVSVVVVGFANLPRSKSVQLKPPPSTC